MHAELVICVRAPKQAGLSCCLLRKFWNTLPRFFKPDVGHGIVVQWCDGIVIVPGGVACSCVALHMFESSTSR
jgi:hypothetical protein